MEKILSVNVGMPRELVDTHGKKVLSAIVKKPVVGSVLVRKLGLEGDKQADLKVHGGVDKAVYAYASENYEYWKSRFPKMDMPWGTFGENLTTEGLLEKDVHVGDRLQIGSSVVLEVTKPRFPCSKLAMRFRTDKMIKLFLDSELSGFYLRVLAEGKIQAGDKIKRTLVNQNSDTITSIVRQEESG
jgi:MOSC domain-containing protein YiiM